MADQSGIQWTDATWNPTTGCTKISPGCKHCYAETMSRRLHRMGQAKYKDGFEYREHHNELDKPFKWKKPKRIFVNSMSDLFHEYATMPFVNMVFHTMLKADWHTYQILTKRPANMAMFVSYFLRENNLEKLPKHIWIGTSCEMQDYTTRIDILRGIPAQVRFVSFEPLLGPIITNLQGIHWAIVGGESGEGHRPIQESWVTNLLANCRHFGTAFFFKQWGGITPKAGGRLLNGITYDEYPQ